MSEKARLPAVVVPKAAFDTFAATAKNEDKTVSEAIREALGEYLVRRGIHANFDVGTWGGKRDSDTESEGQ